MANSLRRLLLSVALLFSIACPALAEEVIRNFISDVTVNDDGSLDVRETIILRSEGNQIKRGIRRDFPTTYTDKNGVRMRVGFEVLRVERDGRDENYVVESISNGKSIKIGSGDVFLRNGEHAYKITYRTQRHIGFFKDFDELYWNVTGNGWTFPIEKASTLIQLPVGASIVQHSVYTGRQGESGKDAIVNQAEGNRFSASTTRRLNPGEGFTVAVAFPKGVVAAPTAAEQQRDWIRDNLGYFIMGLTLLLVPLYYFWAWLRVGRDPPAGTIIPLFRPPEGMGPSGVRYVYKNGYDDKTFAAGLVGLAVKGRMAISNNDDEYSIEKKEGGRTPLTRSEQALFAAAPAKRITLKQSNNVAVRGMRAALEGALDDEYDGVMYLKNFKWFFLGLFFSIIGMILAGFLIPDAEGLPVMAVGLFTALWWGAILSFGVVVVRGLVNSTGIFGKIKSVMAMIFLGPFVLAGVAMPLSSWLSSGASPKTSWYILAAVAIGLCNLIFYWLLKAPTPRGRAVLDEIEGFRMYMTTAEEERLKILHPPEKTPELFERYLPYAMALDCENEWNSKFAAVLAAAAAAGATAGTLGGWYHGSGGFSSRDFGSELGNSLTSAISSSGVAPGSSSGSSGGGFSGGGGGGGGGSGW